MGNSPYRRVQLHSVHASHFVPCSICNAATRLARSIRSAWGGGRRNAERAGLWAFGGLDMRLPCAIPIQALKCLDSPVAVMDVKSSKQGKVWPPNSASKLAIQLLRLLCDVRSRRT
ncbi:hypothetical protein HI914_03761 [Erysiphe necator]|nr:hypothetical protein HI914_03761 [Erysiphe necator]